MEITEAPWELYMPVSEHICRTNVFLLHQADWLADLSLVQIASDFRLW